MKQSTAVIQLEVQRPVCLELYQDCKDLGRFMLRSKGNTIAAGMVTKVGECQSNLCIFKMNAALASNQGLLDEAWDDATFVDKIDSWDIHL